MLFIVVIPALYAFSKTPEGPQATPDPLRQGGY